MQPLIEMVKVVVEPFAVNINFPVAVGNGAIKAAQGGKLLGKQAVFVGARIPIVVPVNVTYTWRVFGYVSS
jgi:hypothetical protein